MFIAYGRDDCFSTWVLCSIWLRIAKIRRLVKNPQDQVAKKERGDLLSEGLKSNTAFSKEQQSNIAKLLVMLDTTTPTAINLQAKALGSPIRQP